MTLFSATLISKDRKSALLQRLYTTPMTAADFILGYTLPLLPIALVQTVMCYFVGIILGLEPSVHLIAGILFNIPVAVFFISLGLLCGSVFTDKQVGGICGALLTNLTAWFSGIWFDLQLVGGWFEVLADLLLFAHAVKLVQYAAAGNYAALGLDIVWVSEYALVIMLVAAAVFLRQMKKG